MNKFKYFKVLSFMLFINLAKANTFEKQKLIETKVEEFRKLYKVPGLAAAYSKGDDFFSAASGVRNAEEPLDSLENQLSDNSIFGIGSCTKSMTATMLAKNVDNGLLKWTSTLGEVVALLNGRSPERPIRISAQLANLTLDSLLTHTAGIPDGYDFLTDKFEESTEHFLEHGAGIMSDEFHYSTLDYSVLAYLTARLANKRWDKLMREDLFGPLGMHRCLIQPGVFSPETHGDTILKKLIPFAHYNNVPEFFNTPNHLEKANVVGGAGVFCPLSDWKKYMNYFLLGKKGKLRVRNDLPWKKETFAHLFENRNPVNYTYGGWESYNDTGFYFHPGGNGAYLAVGGVNLETEEITLIASNSDKMDFGGLYWMLEEIVKALR
jgi:CubicO group peptidase (beta-lactamase class C family)